MKKRGWIAGFLLFALLIGCGVKEAPEQPEEREQAEEAEQTEEEANPTACEPERYLLSEEELAYMYRDGRPNGFDFGGVEEDGAFFYEFTRPEEPDFSLRISEDFETATVYYHGQTMVLNDRISPNGSLYGWHISAGYGGAVSGYGMPFWVDMTGDGQPDLLWLEGGGGTGFHENHCVVYDMAAMTEIPIIEPWQEMAEFITVEPLEWQPDKHDGGNIVCRVTDAEGETYTGYLWAWEEIWQEFAYSGESGVTWIDIDEEACTLQVGMSIGMENPEFATLWYMGDLTTELAYDAEQNAIVRSGPITVSMDPASEG